MASANFWSSPAVEPKRQYRFILEIGGIPSWFVKKVNKPAFEVSETSHKYINHTFWYPGRIEWDKTTLTLVDPVTPDASQTMQRIMNEAGYELPTDAESSLSSISKLKSVLALGSVVIKQLGPESEVIEEIEFVNAWVQSVKYGDLDYESDEMVEIELTLRFDFAQILTSDPGIDPANL